MERKRAELVVKEFKKYGDVNFTIQDAMCMSPILADEDETFGIQKQNIIFLVRFPKKMPKEKICTKIIKW